MTKRKFYKTRVTIDVLHGESPDEIANMEIGTIEHAVTEGECVLAYRDDAVETLDGAQAAKALVDAGSDPLFFHLDDVGDDHQDD